MTITDILNHAFPVDDGLPVEIAALVAVLETGQDCDRIALIDQTVERLNRVSL